MQKVKGGPAYVNSLLVRQMADERYHSCLAGMKTEFAYTLAAMTYVST